MTTLQAQWNEILALEPDDWSHLALQLELDDPERMEEAVLLACSLNPWHGETFRTGSIRFRAARTSGYGANWELVGAMLRRLDEVGIGGRLTVLQSRDAVRLVGTQGPRI